MSLRRELDESGNVWEARMEGLRATLHATEQHAHALEEQLKMRPTARQVCGFCGVVFLRPRN